MKVKYLLLTVLCLAMSLYGFSQFIEVPLKTPFEIDNFTEDTLNFRVRITLGFEMNIRDKPFNDYRQDGEYKKAEGFHSEGMDFVYWFNKRKDSDMAAGVIVGVRGVRTLIKIHSYQEVMFAYRQNYFSFGWQYTSSLKSAGNSSRSATGVRTDYRGLTGSLNIVIDSTYTIYCKAYQQETGPVYKAKIIFNPGKLIKSSYLSKISFGGFSDFPGAGPEINILVRKKHYLAFRYRFFQASERETYGYYNSLTASILLSRY